MARNLGTLLTNNFSRGLISEATGLNFPENAVTDSLNVEFKKLGNVVRRKGYDSEGSASVAEFWGEGKDEGVYKEFIWNTVGNHGGFTFLVLQSGGAVRFFNMADPESVSAGLHHAAIYLEDWKRVGAPSVFEIPVNFSSGGGYLFIAHPSIDPVVVKYDEDDDELAATTIQIFVRDLEGVNDGLAIDEEPENATTQHLYNLYNQGWYKYARIGSVNNELSDPPVRPTSPRMDLVFHNISTGVDPEEPEEPEEPTP